MSQPPTRTRNGRAVLTRERIGEAVLELVRRDGFHQVTMRSLAAELAVTVRALYKLVRDREDARAVGAALAPERGEGPELDPAHWERDLAALCHALRAWYRAYPGLLRLATAVPIGTDVPARTLENGDRIVGFLLGTGLAPDAALHAWELVIGLVAGFADLEDWADRAAAVAADHHPDDVWAPTPERLLEGRDLPNLRAVAAAEPTSPDARFADVIEMLTTWVGARLSPAGAGSRPSPPDPSRPA
jgi:AcrR family transcriptional regulator